LTVIHQNLGREITFVLRLDRFTQVEARAVPRWAPPEGQGPVGIQIALQNPVVSTESLPIWEAVPKAFATTGDVLLLFKNEIAGWFAGSAGRRWRGQWDRSGGRRGRRARYFAVAQLYCVAQHQPCLPQYLADPNARRWPDGFCSDRDLTTRRRVSPGGRPGAPGFVLLLALVLFVSYEDVFRILRRESLLP
jgi:regulator of sigma E protease